MLPRQERLTRRRDFAAVYGRERERPSKNKKAGGSTARSFGVSKTTRSWANDLLVLYVRRNSPAMLEEEAEKTGRAETRRFGFSVSKKVGKAHDRNQVKRRLREICRGHGAEWKTGYDAVFIARSGAAMAEYAVLEEAVCQLARRSQLMLA